MISVGYSNRTPWASPRELDEDDLRRRDRRRGRQAARSEPGDLQPARAAAEHPDRPGDGARRGVPPGGQGRLAGDHRRRVARRCATPSSDYQPMLSLHGHIHESRGEARIGRTLALNPGSEYSEGVLRGVIVNLSPRRRGFVDTSSSPVEVAVIGSARIGPDDARHDDAVRLGAALADAGWTVMTGGYGGLMGATASGAAARGGTQSGLPMRPGSTCSRTPTTPSFGGATTMPSGCVTCSQADVVVGSARRCGHPGRGQSGCGRPPRPSPARPAWSWSAMTGPACGGASPESSSSTRPTSPWRTASRRVDDVVAVIRDLLDHPDQQLSARG